ncbi:very long chain fatty acid elongase AAEL008004-like [Onthophagus taurus]|uniref:very long chain fatty acid elongase AAEL008004-like n=1 Tax=Onthophagus taurus TaxID=166361 RepID=UPI000C209C4D|nr:elongation of very long chain fatty acids protein AAEL008004-like [Onthophagus taurus]
MDIVFDYLTHTMEATANISTYCHELYNYLIYDLADPRTNDWYLVKHPVVFPIVMIYLFVILRVIPRFMKHRKPFELKSVLIVHNFLQVLISIIIVAIGVTGGYFTQTNFRCQPVDNSYSKHAVFMMIGCYAYYLAKYTELLDTVFFALRKKNNQITFLHLYHHSVMPMISWGATKYYPGGHGTFIGMVNSMVHIVMYTYYLISAMGPKYQKFLWWKKYITTIQLLQFGLIFVHHMQLLFYDCGYPRWVTILIMPNAFFFYYLFSDFYNKAYSAKKKLTAVNGVAKIEHAKGYKETNKANDVLNGDIAKKSL